MRIDLSCSASGLAPRNLAWPMPPVPPAFVIERIVLEGDSITSNSPSTYSGEYHSYRYATSRPDLFVEVRAQGSRVVGQAANLDDNGNSVMGNVAEDMAYAPDLVTLMIGTNDLSGGRTNAQHRSDLAAWYDAVKAARPACRVAWSPPLPINAVSQHPNYAIFTARRAELVADCRDPAVWGQWADYFLPLGLHPDFLDESLHPQVFGDTVHPSSFNRTPAGTGGQVRLYEVYKAAIDTLADAARETSTQPYGSVWPESETNLAVSTQIVRRFIVAGIAHTGLASGVGVTGAGAQVRLNGGSWGSATGRIYNGDVIDLRVTTSADHDTPVALDLTIGSETRALTYRTVIAVDPVEYHHGGVFSDPNPSTSKTFTGASFAHSGLAVVASGPLPRTSAAHTSRAAGSASRSCRPRRRSETVLTKSSARFSPRTLKLPCPDTRASVAPAARGMGRETRTG
ncbi:SGNH/GDSL hydrolase family protein [Leptolyngbya sp. 15MV]|nr:SGNH/GDSL hydrolase family protein [Leptolyngbya sp. 15MV]